jgi:hypothetical protein
VLTSHKIFALKFLAANVSATIKSTARLSTFPGVFEPPLRKRDRHPATGLLLKFDRWKEAKSKRDSEHRHQRDRRKTCPGMFSGITRTTDGGGETADAGRSL